MNIQHNISLRPYNTFGIDMPAKTFAAFGSTGELEELLAAMPENEPLLVLGGGSNILLTRPFNGWVLHNRIPGIEVVKEDADFIWVKAGAGQNWHGFVMHCIARNLAGVENLSLIPGCVGASPMQNIGAYGVEIKDIFDSLEAWSIDDRELVNFNREDCAFGYRESVFKRKLKHKFIITSVTFKLSRQPVFHTGYGAIQQELEAMGIKELSIKAVSDAVIRIRQSKLPDPAVTGNAGSFFKNPEIELDRYIELKHAHPDLPGYPTQPGYTKVPAGWLIEKAGWKGHREGDAGVHPKQALVLVNYGNATGSQVFELSAKIMEDVKARFGIELEREVNIY